jgi:hypothetical protein
MNTKNLNISTLHNMLGKIYHEVAGTVSQDVSHMRTPDVVRLESYVAELESYKKHVMSQDPVDWPHAHKMLIELKELPAPTEQENTTIHELLYIIQIMDVEIVKSQSKDLPAGMYKFDSDRFDKNIDYVRSLITHVKNATPTDRPESAATQFDQEQGIASK